MKQNANDAAMLIIIVIMVVGFYAELVIWPAHGWSRNSLGIIAPAAFGLTYLGWRIWSWLRNSNSN